MKSARLASPLLLLGWCLPAGSLSLVARSHSFGRKRTPHPRASGAPPAAVDVAVIGGGPAAYTIAALLSRNEHSVALIDPAPDGAWPNNYGSWRVEWEVRRFRQRPRSLGRRHTHTHAHTWIHLCAGAGGAIAATGAARVHGFKLASDRLLLRRLLRHALRRQAQTGQGLPPGQPHTARAPSTLALSLRQP